jgi:hypothetical protein
LRSGGSRRVRRRSFIVNLTNGIPPAYFKYLCVNRRNFKPFYCVIIFNFVVANIVSLSYIPDRLCGLLGRVLGYRSGGPGSISGTTTEKKKTVGLERGPLSLVSTTEELLDRKVAAPV